MEVVIYGIIHGFLFHEESQRPNILGVSITATWTQLMRINIDIFFEVADAVGLRRAWL